MNVSKTFHCYRTLSDLTGSNSGSGSTVVHRYLRRLGLPRLSHLDHVEQSPPIGYERIRREKETHARAILKARGELGALFGNSLFTKTPTGTPSNVRMDSADKRKHLQKTISQGLRMYRILRPDAQATYHEDSSHAIGSAVNQFDGVGSLVGSRGSNKGLGLKNGIVDPLQFNLPVVNPRSFIIALEAVTNSLCEDLEYFCHTMGVSTSRIKFEDPLRFQGLVDLLFGSFPLRKSSDGSGVDDWMANHWIKVKKWIPTEILEGLSDSDICEFIRGHIIRVVQNQKMRIGESRPLSLTPARTGDEKWYSLSEDFLYDSFPVPDKVNDEKYAEFPFERCRDWMSRICHFFMSSLVTVDNEVSDNTMESNSREPNSNFHRRQSGTHFKVPESLELNVTHIEGIADQFQLLIYDLEKIGLREWMKMSPGSLRRDLPQGHPPTLTGITQDDIETAKIMLRCAARGRISLLDFEAVSPFNMLHGIPCKSIHEELNSIKENPFIPDSELAELIDTGDAAKMLTKVRISNTAYAHPMNDSFSNFLSMHKATPIEKIVEHEEEFYQKIGATDSFVKNGSVDWKWKKPSNTLFDSKRGVYIRQKGNIDPNYNMNELRQFLLNVNHMCAMSSGGRVLFSRAIVAVGNGHGLYGIGIGFGMTVKEARNNAALKAMQKIRIIDFDDGRVLTTPVSGSEYSQRVLLKPLPMGTTLRGNRRHLPLSYLLGFHHCKMRFCGKKWFARVKAIDRAIDKIQSRRTLSISTGKKYASIVAPGDHWVHWPDRWFKEIRKGYESRDRLVSKRRVYHLKLRRKGVSLSNALDIKPGFSPYFRSPCPYEEFSSQSPAFTGVLRQSINDRH